MNGFRYLHDATTLELKESACIGCGRCIEVCPHQVFILEDGGAHLADRDACMECGACQRNCPVNAIRVDAGVGCANGIIKEWLRDRNIQVGGSDCCS
jgi:NAD-dependent dihydropyrimidine dehydrogenase PreA subunit